MTKNFLSTEKNFRIISKFQFCKLHYIKAVTNGNKKENPVPMHLASLVSYLVLREFANQKNAI